MEEELLGGTTNFNASVDVGTFLDSYNASHGAIDSVPYRGPMNLTLFIYCAMWEYRRTVPEDLTMRFYLNGIAAMTVCCVGLLGNISSAVVLNKLRRRAGAQSTYKYLLALSVCDMNLLLCSALFAFTDISHYAHLAETDCMRYLRHAEFEGKGQVFAIRIFPYVHTLALMFQVISVWLTVSFTAERFYTVCFPFESASRDTHRDANIIIPVHYLAGVAFNFPRFWEFTVATHKLPSIKNDELGQPEIDFSSVQLEYYNTLTTFGENNVFVTWYHIIFYFLFYCGLPLVAIGFMNARLMREVRELQGKRQPAMPRLSTTAPLGCSAPKHSVAGLGRSVSMASEASRKRHDTTVMLIGVVVLFILCQIPAFVTHIVWTVDHMGPNERLARIIPFITNVSNALVVLNSAMNIVPYYVFGTSFRRTFVRTFCFWRRRDMDAGEDAVSMAMGLVNPPDRERGTDVGNQNRGSLALELRRRGLGSSAGLWPQSDTLTQRNTRANSLGTGFYHLGGGGADIVCKTGAAEGPAVLNHRPNGITKSVGKGEAAHHAVASTSSARVPLITVDPGSTSTQEERGDPQTEGTATCDTTQTESLVIGQEDDPNTMVGSTSSSPLIPDTDDGVKHAEHIKSNAVSPIQSPE